MSDMEFLAELFEPLGDVTFRRMFSGVGAYRHGVIFALVLGDVIHLKVDDVNRPAFLAEASTPFSYARKDGRIVATSYWRIPDRLLDDPEELRVWSLAAIDASIRASAAKAAKPRKPAKAGKTSKPRRPLSG